MRHYTDASGFVMAKERPERWNMLHPIDVQRGEDFESQHPRRFVGELMREPDGALWYGDSQDDYPPDDGSVEVESVVQQDDGTWVAM